MADEKAKDQAAQPGGTAPPKDGAKPAAGKDAGKDGKEKQNLKDFFSSLSGREQALAYAAGFIVIVLIFDKIMLSPIINKIKSIKEEIRAQMVLANDGLMIIQYKDIINKEYNMFRSYFADKKGSHAEERAKLLKEMENRATEAGIHLVNINALEEAQDTPFYTKYEVKLECEGTMEQLIKFSYEVSASEQPTKVETIEVLPPAQGTESLTCTLVISRIVVTI